MARIAALTFVGASATLVFNSFKADPITGEVSQAQSRREYMGENTAGAVSAFARKVLGRGAESASAVEVAPGMYSIETPDAGKAKK